MEKYELTVFLVFLFSFKSNLHIVQIDVGNLIIPNQKMEIENSKKAKGKSNLLSNIKISDILLQKAA